MAYRILCKARVPAWMRGQLESLLYFNGGQYRVRDGIAASIARYGAPELVEEESGLRVAVDRRHDVQTLWAVREEGDMSRVVGVLVYLREAGDEVTVVQVGVADDYAQGGPYASEHVLARLLQQARRIARDTAGVRHLGLAYRQSRVRLSAAWTA